jgi:hypothetical protein
VAAEIQLLTCGYTAQFTVRKCRARATIVARYTDGQGRPLKQRELCDRHADWLKANRLNVRDLSIPDALGGENRYPKADGNLASVQDPRMPGAIVVIGRSRPVRAVLLVFYG